MTEQRIGQNTQVTLHFALRLENGDTVDSTFDKAPATFKVGDGNLLPGFEAALFGFKAGDKRTLQILPENAFGQPICAQIVQTPHNRATDGRQSRSAACQSETATGDAGGAPAHGRLALRNQIRRLSHVGTGRQG